MLTSIALEETALSHIISAEGEKIQYILEYAKSHESENDVLDKLVQINDSATSMLASVGRVETVLKEKMTLVMGHINNNTDQTLGASDIDLRDGSSVARRNNLVVASDVGSNYSDLGSNYTDLSNRYSDLSNRLAGLSSGYPDLSSKIADLGSGTLILAAGMLILAVGIPI